MLTHWFEVIDPRFLKLVYGSVDVETLAQGCRFAEGPIYVPAGRYLLCSDIPNNRILRWDETNQTVSTFREPSGYANGNTLDRQGRLLTCEHGGRRLSRTEHDGSVTILADRFNGGRLNSPNDVVVKSDDTIWFTDPSYGIETLYEGDFGTKEQQGCYVFRLDPRSRRMTIATDKLEQPNGLVFSPDERILYIVDSGGSHRVGGPKHIRRFEVSNGGTLLGGEVFAQCDVGIFDGIAMDHLGNVWASAGDGVYCYASDGTLIGRIKIPEVVSNLVFGGLKRNRLFITGASSIYAVYLKTYGVPLSYDKGPFASIPGAS
jgi:gluconolactonase